MYGVYNPDRTIHTTTVPGTSWTGLYAVDGSINIVLDSVGNGVYHKCGALRVSSSTSTNLIYDPSGAYYSNHILGFVIGLSGPWSPLNDPALVAWWDASSLVGTPVPTWTDKKGGIIATAGTSPTWSATARNSKPGVVFTGTESLAFTPTGFPSGAASGTILVAGISTVSVANATGNFAFSYGSNNTNAGQTRYIDQQPTSGGTPLGTEGGTGNSGSNTDDVFTWANTDRCVIYQVSGQIGFVNTDGNTAATMVMVPTTNTLLTGGAIGLWPGFGASWIGTLQQILVTSATVSTSLRQKYEGWESWYDGKAGANLPGGHPYKSRAPTTSDP